MNLTKDFYLKKDVIALTRAVKIGHAHKYVFGVDISPDLFERLAFDYCQKTTNTTKSDDKYICGIYHDDGSILFYSDYSEEHKSIFDTEAELTEELLRNQSELNLTEELLGNQYELNLTEQKCYDRKLEQCTPIRATISIPDSKIKMITAGCNDYTIKKDFLFDQSIIVVVRNKKSGLGLRLNLKKIK